MHNLSYTSVIGGMERKFHLTPSAIAELETKTGMGIGALIQSFALRNYRLQHLMDTIISGLAGAGTMTATEAGNIVAAYVREVPIMAVWALASNIASAAYIGLSTDADLEVESA